MGLTESNRIGNRRSLRLGLYLPIDNYRPVFDPHQLDLALLADQMGLDSLWLRDVIISEPAPSDVGAGYEIFCHLSWLAARTSRIRLGTAAVSLNSRDPILTAKQAASVWRLSGGRFELGLGPGSRDIENNQYAPNHELRRAQFDEYKARLTDCLQTRLPRTRAGETFMTAPCPVYELPIWITADPSRSSRSHYKGERFLMHFKAYPDFMNAVYSRNFREAEPLALGMTIWLNLTDPDLTMKTEQPKQVAFPIIRARSDSIVQILLSYWVAGLDLAIIVLAGGPNTERQIRALAERVLPQIEAAMQSA
jgi:hypothetical protein